MLKGENLREKQLFVSERITASIRSVQCAKQLAWAYRFGIFAL